MELKDVEQKIIKVEWDGFDEVDDGSDLIETDENNVEKRMIIEAWTGLTSAEKRVEQRY